MGGAQTKSQEKNLCIQLHNAISGGNEDIARELLLCGAVNPNNKLFNHSRKLDPPLFTAIENNCLSMVEVLLQYDAKISTFNKAGFTPLHVAVSQNLVEIAETLIRHNADPAAPNAQGESSLHVAATYGLVNMTALLLRSGASVNCRGKLNRTPLHSACAIPGNTSMAMSLLNHGADPDLQDEELRTPLHYLALLGNSQGIDFLLQSGSSKNTPDVNGKSALHVSVENEEITATRALLRHQCDVNWQDGNGQTPLHKAVEKEFVELVNILLQNHADPNIPSTSLFPLRTAVWKKNINITKILLENGADVNAADRNGITSLHVACLYALKEDDSDVLLVEQLLCAGANINAQCTKHRRTPLHNAVEGGNEEIVLILLHNGADTTLEDSKGRTALTLSTNQAITDIISDNDRSNGTLDLTPVSRRREQNQTPSPSSAIRRMNVYIRPTSALADGGQASAAGPPPVPPRDSPQVLGLNHMPPHGCLGGTLPLTSSVPVIRHNFTWTPREPEVSPSIEPEERASKLPRLSRSKLFSFSTSFHPSTPHVLCYSVTPSKQTITTDLGCMIDIEHSSVHSNLLLYVEGRNYSSELLPLPSGVFVCSNIVSFFTHSAPPPRARGDPGPREKPEREFPHFSKPVSLKFALRPAAMRKYDRRENEFKVFANFDDDGVTRWEELDCKLEEPSGGEGDDAEEEDAVHFLSAKTHELGMHVALLCPRLDVKHVTDASDKIISSVEHGISASVTTNHTDSCTLELEALMVSARIIEQLQKNGFSYVVGSSRDVRLKVKCEDESESPNRASLSVKVPCSTVVRTNSSDTTHRILMKTEKLQNGDIAWSDSDQWRDVTDTECEQLNISQKGKKLLGQATNDPVYHVSFSVTIDVPLHVSFLVLAVRSYTSTLSAHLKLLPRCLAAARNTSAVRFSVTQKTNRPSDVTCDITTVDASSQSSQKPKDSKRDSQTSDVKEIQERDCIVISATGGVRIKQKNDTCRRATFHAALQPSFEQFFIKGTACHQNSSTRYSGSVEFAIDPRQRNNSSTRLRSPLTSESSVLVMENSLATTTNDPTASSSTSSAGGSPQKADNSVLASIPVELPRKSRQRKSGGKQSQQDAAARASEKSFLSDSVIQKICRSLDEHEVKELAFQLAIDDEKVKEAFANTENNPEQAGLNLVKQWRLESAVRLDVVSEMCLALRCIGRENLSHDVTRRCNPFLESSVQLPSLPVFTRNFEVAAPAERSTEAG